MKNIYTPNEIRLANDIATTLKDRDSVGLHLKFVRKYKEEYLREKLAKVMAIDEAKITSSRAALYVWMIQKGDSGDDARH